MPSMVIMAFGLWFVSFYLNPFNFWLEMAGSVAILAITSLISWKNYKPFGELTARNVGLGVVSALMLYGVFWLGNLLIVEIIPFAESEIAEVYGNTDSAALPIIGLLLALIIGPGEEIFWRGTVQRWLEDNYGGLIGIFAGALLYAIVHVWSLNLTLVVAALVAGLGWSWFYAREGELLPVVISHSVWSVLIFLIIPI